MTLNTTSGPTRIVHANEPDEESVLERKFGHLVPLDSEEMAQLRDLQARTEKVRARSDILESGAKAHPTAVILDGWAYRYKTLENGRRQIIAFLLPGDFVSLYAPLLSTNGASVRTLTDVTISKIAPREMLDLFRNHARMASVICWSAAETDRILAEHIVSLGRRSAYQRISHLFLELLFRLDAVGLADGDTIEFPVTQEAIADTLGLSIVHVNRTLKRLRAEGHIEVNGDLLRIPRFDTLARIAHFDRDYLVHRRLPDRLVHRLIG